MIKYGKAVLQGVAVFVALTVMTGVIALSTGMIFGADRSTLEKTIGLTGSGTREDPYLIGSTEELCRFRDAVNAGESFSGKYFLQTCDLDLESESPWEPIGKFGSGCYFYGTYDGGNQRIHHLNCYPEDEDTANNICLFGQLGGVVENLGIESGSIRGSYVGSFASHSIGDNAAIVNCYNRADVTGSGRAGGICDNFSRGLVANCVNCGTVSGGTGAQIVSYNAAYAINVYPRENAVAPSFSGAFMEYMTEDMTDVCALLNRGIDDLRSAGALTQYDLKYWPVEGRQ